MSDYAFMAVAQHLQGAHALPGAWGPVALAQWPGLMGVGGASFSVSCPSWDLLCEREWLPPVSGWAGLHHNQGSLSQNRNSPGVATLGC